eukprot:3177973-Amphidinium_carterae.1
MSEDMSGGKVQVTNMLSCSNAQSRITIGCPRISASVWLHAHPFRRLGEHVQHTGTFESAINTCVWAALLCNCKCKRSTVASSSPYSTTWPHDGAEGRQEVSSASPPAPQ